MTLAFEFAHKIQEMRTPEQEILLIQAMHHNSLPVRSSNSKVHLPTLTDDCLQPKYDYDEQSPTARADANTLAKYGILPADYFEGDTRKERLLSRAIARVAAQNTMAPEDLFVKTTIDDDDYHVECVQCGNLLRSNIGCGHLAGNMRTHLNSCKGRRKCINCSLDFSSIGLFGISRTHHEKNCLSNNEFQQILNWLAGTVDKVVDTEVIGQFGFPKSGFADGDKEYSKAECIKKYTYIRTKLVRDTTSLGYDQPRYHQLLLAVNNVRSLRGMKPLANRFATSEL